MDFPQIAVCVAAACLALPLLPLVLLLQKSPSSSAVEFWRLASWASAAASAVSGASIWLAGARSGEAFFVWQGTHGAAFVVGCFFAAALSWIVAASLGDRGG